MRIIDGKSKNELKIHVDSDDDLWYLKNIVVPGDQVKMTTLRRVEKQQDLTRSKETSRKPVTVTISVENVEFQDFSGILKILGTIMAGPEDIMGMHQSFNVASEENFTLLKENWTLEQDKLLSEAVENKFSDKFYFITLDDESAQLILLRSYGLQEIGKIESHKTGKDYDTDSHEGAYYREVVESSRRMFPEESTITILGPGFSREKLVDAFREYGVLKFRVLTFPATRPDSGAVWEFLNGDESESVLKNLRLSGDARLVESFLKHVKTDSLATYGYDGVRSALEAGAVETLLISEDKFRTKEGRILMDVAHNFATRSHIISSGTEKGKIVEGFGGYCAILRFRY